MKKYSISANLKRVLRSLWAITLLSLPVTSFRYFPGLSETTFVRPLAFYPIILLLPILAIQVIRKKMRTPWPGSLLVLGVFLLVTLVASTIGGMYAPLVLRGHTYLERVVRAWLTVLIGLTFFVSAIWMNQEERDLKFSLRWLGIGLVLDILWSGVQAISFYTPLLDKVVVTHWQLAFSMRELVRTNRVSGLAYEPAWLAGQLATLYLPWLFAAVLTRTHFTRFKWLEPLLLGLTGLLLLSTYSRGGLVTALGAVVLTLLMVGGPIMRSVWRWFVEGFELNRDVKNRRYLAFVVRVGTVLAVLLVLIGSFALLGQKNYFARIWNSRAETLADFVIENSAGARGAYAWAAFSAFNEHPWLGVGLGASGFYIYDHLPDWSLTTVPEIARQLNPSNRLYPNPKNFYLRVLVETGLVGFSVYLAFIIGMLGDALAFFRTPGFFRFIGIAGVFSWFAISIYNLTQDSFATVNIWINFGMIAGMAGLTKNNVDALEEGQ
jgi:O-antigen ligase